MSILLTQKISKEGIDLLEANFKVKKITQKISKKELMLYLKNIKALICSVNDIIDKEVMEAGNNLQIISNVAVGYDNIDIEVASKKGIIVTNTPNTLEQSVSEFVFAHILSLTRKIVESDKYIRDGKFKEWSLNLFLGVELKNKTLGVVGFGSMGQSLIPIAKGFEMKMVYTNRSGEIFKYKNSNIKYLKLNELLEVSDVVVLLVDLNNSTRHLITKRQLKIMKKTAILINMSRGGVVKEGDLIEALKEKKIVGATLDVFEFEPKIPSEIKKMNNVILTPHIGSATMEARNRMSVKAAQNVIDVLTKGKCKFMVNANLCKIN